MLPLAARFVAAGFRCIAPYLRGYRPSDPAPDGDYGTVSLARDAVGLIDAAGAETATIVGHDWGAVTAYVAASLAPARVRRIVTMSVPPPRIFFPSFLRYPALLRRSWYMGDFRRPALARLVAERRLDAGEALGRERPPRTPATRCRGPPRR